MTKLTEENIMDMAMGVGMENLIDEATQIKAAKDAYMVVGSNHRERLNKRRRLRKTMFDILKRVIREQEDLLTMEQLALKEIIDEQLDPNLAIHWTGFTFIWDIHPSGVPTLVRKEAWVKEGGGFDPDIGVHFPAAFTEQVIE